MSAELRPNWNRLTAVFILVCFALWFHDRKALTRQREQDLRANQQFSNAWHVACLKLNEQKAVNSALERDLAALAESAKDHSTHPGTGPGPEPLSLADPRVAELQEERSRLTEQMDELTLALSRLESQMAETQRKLHTSEGDRDWLLQELKRLKEDKSKLTQQFQEIAAVRAQLHKLRADQAIKRRLTWAGRGLYGNLKGGELLRKGLASAPPTHANYDLDVELRRDSQVKAGATLP